jgi:hypothetical protein
MFTGLSRTASRPVIPRDRSFNQRFFNQLKGCRRADIGRWAANRLDRERAMPYTAEAE